MTNTTAPSPDYVSLYIDPGVHQCAVSTYVGGLLSNYGMYDFGSVHLVAPVRGRRVSLIVVERPEYQGQRGRPKDIIDLAWAGARMAYALSSLLSAPVRELPPSRWKGTVPKPQHHARLWDVLTPGERVILGGAKTLSVINRAVAKGIATRWSKPGASYYGANKIHNILDAVALGCFDLGRLEKT